MSQSKRRGGGFASPEHNASTKPPCPKEQAAHAELERKAVQHIQQGNLKEAEKIYKELIAAGSNHFIVYSNLAAICGMQGKTLEIMGLLKTALRLNPGNPEAHNNLGNAQGEQGDLRAAIESFKKALKLRPQYPDAYNNLGNALQKTGDTEGAISCYTKAISLRPEYADAHYNLGNALKSEGKLAQAIAAFNEAIKLRPSHLEARNNLGTTLRETGEVDKAIGIYEHLLSLAPQHADAHTNLGVALQQAGEIQAAIRSHQMALQIEPEHIAAKWNLALCLLLVGDYKNGLEAYEARNIIWKENQASQRAETIEWSTKRLQQGERILLISEQGLGDTLQFMRYVPELRKQGHNATLCAANKLHALIQASGIDSAPLTLEQAHALSNCQQIPLISIARLLAISPTNPLVSKAYIATTQTLREKWKAILGQEQAPIIGINWQGNPDTETKFLQGRSIELETLKPIAKASNGRLLSLQKGFGSEQLEGCSFQEHFVSCQDRVSQTWDFMETAAIIDNCDLVITTDTVVAHLAGGLGKPTWLLLQKVPDWRWGLEGDSSFWYPSMRLFRQKERGNWHTVVELVARELQQHASIPGTTRNSLDQQGSNLSGGAETNEIDTFHRQPALTDQTNAETHRALQIKTAQADRLVEQGHMHFQQGDIEQSLSFYQAALDLDTSHAGAHLSLGRLYKTLAEYEAAVNHFEASLTATPALAADWNRLGMCLRACGQPEKAIRAYSTAITLEPNEATYHINLSNAYNQTNQHQLALEAATKAIELKPDLPESWNALGISQFSTVSPAWPTNSIDSFKQSLQRRSDFPDALNNLGLAYQANGDLSEAIASYQQALCLRGSYPSARLNLATAQLLGGDYTQGWINYEFRLQANPEQSLHAKPSGRHWTGSPLKADEALLIVSEQGLGDTLQFVRYIVSLKSNGVATQLCAPTKLHQLIRASGLELNPLSPQQAPTGKDLQWTPLLSLPQHLGVSPSQPIIQEPYLRTRPELQLRWSKILATEQRPIIALNWQGNPKQETTNSQGRSLPLEAFAPLAEACDARFLALQKGAGHEQLQHCSFRDRFVDCQPLIDQTWDFLETAAIIANCDLVITSDTAVAHLAGGMGHPTWLLLKHVPDWRWGLEGDTSFWYPSMRLFRQRRHGDWGEVMQRVADTLRQLRD